MKVAGDLSGPSRYFQFMAELSSTETGRRLQARPGPATKSWPRTGKEAHWRLARSHTELCCGPATSGNGVGTSAVGRCSARTRSNPGLVWQSSHLRP